MKRIKAGLFGFGVVGEGIYQVLQSKPSIGVDIKKIVIKHVYKERNAPTALFSSSQYSILNDEEIELVIELIDDANAALEIVLNAMNNGKSVVSANKKMIAENFELLIRTARKNKVSFLYEAAVCGSVPVIRNLEEYYDNDLITSFAGIINGSTNYILTQMAKQELSYAEALTQAQALGFAESNPALDVKGIDAQNKLKIIILHAYGKLVADKDITTKGIDTLTAFDFRYAKEKGYVIKLVASCRVDETGALTHLYILPAFLKKNHSLRLTDNEFNGVLIGGQLTDEQFLYGKGAGRYPTSSAVLSDISAYRYGYKYEYKKGVNTTDYSVKNTELSVYISHDKTDTVNFSEYGKIDCSYESDERNYVVLKTDTNRLSDLITNDNLSVIAL